MKFDCIIGNPPFNDETSTCKAVAGGNTKRMTKKLHLKFLDRSINAVEKGGDVAIICPATKWWIGASAEKNKIAYTKKGMRRVFNASKNGPAFDGASIDNIGVFHVQPSDEPKLLSDEFAISIKKPQVSLTDLFKFHSNPNATTRGELQKIWSQKGKYKIWGTVSVYGYTNSNEFTPDNSRGNWRVIFNINYGASKEHLGPIEIASPEEYLSYSTSCLEVNSYPQARDLVKYLKSDAAREIIKQVKKTNTNAKSIFSYLDGSQFAEGV